MGAGVFGCVILISIAMPEYDKYPYQRPASFDHCTAKINALLSVSQTPHRAFHCTLLFAVVHGFECACRRGMSGVSALWMHVAACVDWMCVCVYGLLCVHVCVFKACMCLHPLPQLIITKLWFLERSFWGPNSLWKTMINADEWILIWAVVRNVAAIVSATN